MKKHHCATGVIRFETRSPRCRETCFFIVSAVGATGWRRLEGGARYRGRTDDRTDALSRISDGVVFSFVACSISRVGSLAASRYCRQLFRLSVIPRK